MSHKVPFMGDKTFIQIYAYNENPRATAMGTGIRVLPEKME